MRRIHVEKVSVGRLALDTAQVRHLQTVLRLRPGDTVEVFDDHGTAAPAILCADEHDRLLVQIDQVTEPAPPAMSWTIASAVPKGPRGDWMIEKLSELGTAVFVPLATTRSVVLPDGPSKRQRWLRLAAQAAEQCRRTGVMRIDDLIDLPKFIAHLPLPAWYLSTEPSAKPIGQAIAGLSTAASPAQHLTLLIGPEGGWTAQEMELMFRAGFSGVGLGTTILRIETAAIAAAAVVATVLAPVMNTSEPHTGPKTP